MRNAAAGLTLLELLISLALSMLMTLVLIQLHLQSSLAIERQQITSRQLANAAAVQHILSHSIRDALYAAYTTQLDGNDPDVAIHSFADDGCSGIVIYQQCLPPVMAWKSGTGVSANIAGLVNDSHVLQVKQSCCADVVADQYYLAHRGGVRSNPASLYRRRMTVAGSYLAAVELVEGVTELTASFIVERPLVGDLVLLDAHQVADWWQVRAVRIQYRLHNGALQSDEYDSATSLFGFTLASRQWHQM